MKPKKPIEINDLLTEILAELRAIREALARPQSTWLDIQGAAAHARVPPDSIRRMAIEYTSPSGALYWIGDGEQRPLDIFTDELHNLAYIRRVFSRSKHLSTLTKALPAMVTALGGER